MQAFSRIALPRARLIEGDDPNHGGQWRRGLIRVDDAEALEGGDITVPMGNPTRSEAPDRSRVVTLAWLRPATASGK